MSLVCNSITLLEYHFQKTLFDQQEPHLVQKLGQHFIVGYTDFNDIKALVHRGAIAGVYFTHRNIRDKTWYEIKNEIAELQKIQAQNGRLPLIIACDQEGGAVSHLSPLIQRQETLGQLIQSKNEGKSLEKTITLYATKKAKALNELGINLNLAPVVDLKNTQNKIILDFHSRISERAISDNPWQVKNSAETYLNGLESQGVFGTLKHFPGLSLVKNDTHFKIGQITKSIANLENREWIPFRNLSQRDNAVLMLGHVKVNAIDPHLPSSLSEKIIQKLIREKWQSQAILISDDFSMGPILQSKGGIRTSSQYALNAGLDLILISYDPDLYYFAMNRVIQNLKNGEFDVLRLESSQKRLQRFRSKILQKKTLRKESNAGFFVNILR